MQITCMHAQGGRCLTPCGVVYALCNAGGPPQELAGAVVEGLCELERDAGDHRVARLGRPGRGVGLGLPEQDALHNAEMRACSSVLSS